MTFARNRARTSNKYYQIPNHLSSEGDYSSEKVFTKEFSRVPNLGTISSYDTHTCRSNHSANDTQSRQLPLQAQTCARANVSQPWGGGTTCQKPHVPSGPSSSSHRQTPQLPTLAAASSRAKDSQRHLYSSSSADRTRVKNM